MIWLVNFVLSFFGGVGGGGGGRGKTFSYSHVDLKPFSS